MLYPNHVCSAQVNIPDVPFPLCTALSLGRHIVRYYPGDVHQPVLGLQKSRLAGTGVLLMTHNYLAAHHEISGRPHPAPRAAGTGLAGACSPSLLPHRRPRSPSIAATCSRSAGATATWLQVRAPGGPGVRTRAGSGPGPAARTAAGQVQGDLAVQDPRGEHGCVRPCRRAGERAGRSRCDVFAACIAPKVIRAARPPCGGRHRSRSRARQLPRGGSVEPAGHGCRISMRHGAA
jgi:hypothetical protein